MHDELGGKGLVVVGVDLGEDAETVRKFAEHFGLPFPVLLDPKATTARLFGLWGHPSTVLIDRRGRVLALVRGERDWQSDAAHRLVRHLLEDG